MILSCGEALIDMLPRQIEGEGSGFLPVSGGALFNTAIALGRLGEDSGFICSISTDMFGEQLIDALHQSKVNTDLCVRSDLLSTLAVVRLVDGHAQYTFFDENSAGRNLQFEQVKPLPDEVTALQFGCISLIPEPCGTAFEQLMAANQDKVLCLDPNIRPTLIEDSEKHRARINRMAAMADVIKVSDEDLDWIANGESSEAIMSAWLAGNTSVVLMTKGGDGVDAHTPSGITHQSASKVEVVDTIGAGDTFNAGFLAGLRREGLLSKSALADVTSEQLSPVLAFAAKVAAHTVSRAGANPPWQHEL
ncbi:MAG: carbohydrate kinase [Rhizobiaceae bacterium]